MRNYKRKTNYVPMTEDKLATARSLIAIGVSIRQAAREIGFHESTLRDRLKKGGGDKLGRFRKTFSADQEHQIVRHCIDLDKRFFGLTLKSLRFLLYTYAEENNISHKFSAETQLAGRDFTRDFMKRNKLSLRIPRKTSVARTMGFNRIQLSRYFVNLEAVMKKFNFGPSQIFNMDETGVQTIPNILSKHVAPTGKREVAKAVAAEQGQTVTAVCAVNPLGYFVPPFFIYARKRETRLLIKGGPLGCDMAVTEKGYMNTPTFIKWLKHFQKYSNPSKDNPVLLILDNHVSHTNLEAVTLAKSNHIHLLTLPPHSSHKTQPLDRCFFRALKTYYDAAVDSWDVCNPGETFSVFDVAESFKVAFEKASTVENAAQAFRATGIYPFNPNTFSDVDFLPSDVTDQPADEDIHDDDDRQIIFFNERNELNSVHVQLKDVGPHQPSTSTSVSEDVSHDQSSTSTAISIFDGHNQPSTSAAVFEGIGNDQPSTSSAINVPAEQYVQQDKHKVLQTPTKGDTSASQARLKTPKDIIPLPKIKIKRKRKGKGLKSQLLTSTPNKERLEQELAEREKQAAEKEKRSIEKKNRQKAKVTKQHFQTKNPTNKKKKINKQCFLTANPAKKRKLNEQSSSDSDAEYSVHDSSSDSDFLSYDDVNLQDDEIESSSMQCSES